MRAPTCNQPCRQCHTDALNLGKIPDAEVQISPEKIIWPLRDLEETIEYVTSAHNNEPKAVDALKENGLQYYTASILSYFIYLTRRLIRVLCGMLAMNCSHNPHTASYITNFLVCCPLTLTSRYRQLKQKMKLNIKC